MSKITRFFFEEAAPFRSLILICIAFGALCGPLHAEQLGANATRHANFTVNQGTWMSVDVSPDGESVAFDLLGDIYLVSMNGGKAERLVSGSDYAVQPIFSPDGKSVAFVSDRSGSMNVWIYDLASKELKQFTREKIGEQIFFADPFWSADGKSILVWTTRRRNWFLGNVPREIRQYSISDGGAIFQSLTGAGAQSISGGAEAPSLSSDNRYLYYARFRENKSPFYGDRVLPEWQLEMRDLATGASAPLTRWRGSGMAPALSPDNRYLVYGSRDGAQTGLRLLDLTTGADRWLVFPVDRDQQESNFFYNLPAMSFTPDSKAVVASFDGRINRIDIETGEINIIPFEADVDQELAPLTRIDFSTAKGTVPLRRVKSPVLSPDGSTLAFEATGFIWLADANGENLRRLNNQKAQQYDPSWSADGGAIVYSAFSDKEGGAVFVKNLGEKTDKKLTDAPGNYIGPVFAEDRLGVYVTRMGGHPEIPAPPYSLLFLPFGDAPAVQLDPVTMFTVKRPGHAHVDRMHTGKLLFGTVGALAEIGLPEGKPQSLFAQIIGAQRAFTDSARNLNVVDAESLTPSPDGTKLLAVVGEQVYLIDLARMKYKSGDAIVLFGKGRRAEGVIKLSDIGGETPSWSQNGKSVFYSLGDRIYRHDMKKGGGFSSAPDKILTITIDRAADKAEGALLLMNARIITMNGDEIIENGKILIQDGRITAIGRKVAAPKEAKKLNLGGATIMPGIIDTHAHPETGSESPGGWPQQPSALLDYVAFGVTTIFDPYQPLGDLEYADAVAAGDIIGPRIFGTGPAIHWWRANFETPDDARRLIDRYQNYWGAQTLKNYVLGDRRDRQWLAAAAHEVGAGLTIEGEDFNYNLTHVIDGYGGMAHTVGVAPLYEDVLNLMAIGQTSVSYQFGTLRGEGAPSAVYYFMNIYDPMTDEKVLRFNAPERLSRLYARRLEFHPSEHAFPLLAEQAATLMEAGVTVSLGDHGVVGGLGDHWEIWAASTGMSNIDALRKATIEGAKTLGLEDELGSLEVGKRADLIILKENPLVDVQNTLTIEKVMKNGRLYDGGTLNEIWPRTKPLAYEPWWRAEEPEPRLNAPGQKRAPAYQDFNGREK